MYLLVLRAFTFMYFLIITKEKVMSEKITQSTYKRATIPI